MLTKLADAANENVAVWESLPGVQWYGPVLRAKAGSEVLAVHEDAGNEYGRIPLLVTRTYGAGKVLYMATDGAWRWRKGVEDRYHYRFWGQVVRWMAYRRNMAKGERMSGKRASDQSAVWRDVEESLAKVGAPSPTRAVNAAYEHRREHLEKAVAAVRPLEHQRGAVYLVNGRLAGIEVFDKAATFAKLSPKLARSYALDAGLDGEARKADPLVVSLTLARLKTLKVEAYPGTDLGHDLRLTDEALSGAALVADEAVLHLEAFAKN